MPSDENLTEFLRRRKSEAQDRDDPPVDWEKAKQDWLEGIGGLYRSIREWLSGAEGEGLVKFRQGTVRISEDHLGMYDAPTLSLDLGDKSVDLVPSFRLTLGALGRVNAFCGARKALILRSDDVRWGIGIREPGASRIVPLTEESFQDLLKDLTR